MAIKSLLTNTRVERAVRAHNCQANSKHRLQKGDIRLAVRNGRSRDYYCAECAKKIIERDLKTLERLQSLEPPEPQT
jgi:hypothetical protein